MPLFSVDDVVDYHSVVGGEITSKGHTIIDIVPTPNAYGRYVALLTGHRGVVALDALSKTEGLMNFSEALDNLKLGFTVRRYEWAGCGLNLVVKLQRPDAHSKMSRPYLYVEHLSEDNKIVLARFPWIPTHPDILSNNWEVC